MKTFNDLYELLLYSATEEGVEGAAANLAPDEYDPRHLDCLLHPENHPPIIRTGDCTCDDTDRPCERECLFDAIKKDSGGVMTIDKDLCTGCARCVDACREGKLAQSRDALPALQALRRSGGRAYALIAPAFIGQFSPGVTPGMLRSAFKRLGFDGMVEVALFADILTLREALEFDRSIKSEKDFLLTSCCCPIWIAMIRKVYSHLVPHVPAAVSPMVASGRTIKLLYPDAITIFVGPCVAKKAEARESDIKDAVDFVLTFEEMGDIFDAFCIDPAAMDDDPREHSSRSGRLYARAGGVSGAVGDTVRRLSPNRAISLKSRRADGVPACKTMLNELLEGNISENFIEGMGCRGGCVGGPKAILSPEEGQIGVEKYADSAPHLTPVDNPFVMDLLSRLGFDTLDSLLKSDSIFSREF